MLPTHPLEDKDKKRAQDAIKNDPFFKNNKPWIHALQDMVEMGVRVEQQAFAARGLCIVRDKKDLGYKGSIEAFEQRIGRGQCVALVISDKYLRSPHCMYELLKMQDNLALRERIFPLVLADALA